MPRRRSLFGSSVRSKHCKTLVHSRSNSSSCSTANKENAPSSSYFSSLSSNQTGPHITPKICRLPLSSLQTTPSSQQLTTCPQVYTQSSAYKIRNHVGPSFKRLRQYEEQEQHQSNKSEATTMAKDSLDFYQIIHNDFLLQLMRNTTCSNCSDAWNGTMSIRKREGI
ncbi:unnamed protein product [Rotaria sp. Silwood1]|nr:unnamed protein product [Rotaria sp. Silwood1]CAF1685156.1 unnamed protein product [Rotaria sp. Silwood1]CAF3830661.1 unnamed protein product [Rotaria sp. Silwood1]CAF3872315.1 unnamed protein product [Rotaria sp. Silwood1]CAF3891467.1 unnamed protein product [Rotaria sp. Silwood1]